VSTAGQPPAPATAQDIVDLKTLLGNINKRFDTVDENFKGIDKRFITADKNFMDIGERLNTLDKNFNSLKGSVDNLRGDYAEDRVRESLLERGIFSRNFISRRVVRGLPDLVSMIHSEASDSEMYLGARSRSFAGKEKEAHDSFSAGNSYDVETMRIVNYVRDHQADKILMKSLLVGSNLENSTLPNFFSSDKNLPLSDFEGMLMYHQESPEVSRLDALQKWADTLSYDTVNENNSAIVLKMVEFGQLNYNDQLDWLRSHNAPASLLLLGACFGLKYMTHELEFDLGGGVKFRINADGRLVCSPEAGMNSILQFFSINSCTYTC
jgi:hypothetical protein